jgi:hypothetical protein
MSQLPLVNTFFVDRARTLRMLLEFVWYSRAKACDAIKSGAFTPDAVELATMVNFSFPVADLPAGCIGLLICISLLFLTNSVNLSVPV